MSQQEVFFTILPGHPVPIITVSATCNIIQRVDEREQTLTAEIKRWHSETVSAFAERRDQLEAIRKDAEGAFREHKDSVAATAASFRFGIVLKKK